VFVTRASDRPYELVSQVSNRPRPILDRRASTTVSDDTGTGLSSSITQDSFTRTTISRGSAKESSAVQREGVPGAGERTADAVQASPDPRTPRVTQGFPYVPWRGGELVE